MFRKFLNRPSSWALLDQMLASASNFLTTLLMARMLDVKGFALYSLAAITVLFVSGLHRSILTQPLNVLGASESDSARYTRYAGLLSLQKWFSVPCAAIIVAVGWLFYPDPGIVAATIFYATGFLTQEIVRRYYYTINDIRGAFFNDCIAYGGQILLLALLWWKQSNHATTALVAMGLVFSVAALIGHLRQRTRRPADFDRPNATQQLALFQQHWRFSIWTTLSQFTYWGSSQIYPFLLARYLDHTVVANFNAANSLLNALNILRLMLSNYLPSRAATVYAAHQTRGLLRYLWRMTIVYGGLTLLMVLGLVLASDWIVRLLFAGKYPLAAELLPYMSISNSIIIVGVIVNAGALVVKVTEWSFYGYAAGTVFSLIAGPYLIVHHGIWGGILALSIGSTLPSLIQGAHFVYHCLQRPEHVVG